MKLRPQRIRVVFLCQLTICVPIRFITQLVVDDFACQDFGFLPQSKA